MKFLKNNWFQRKWNEVRDAKSAREAGFKDGQALQQRVGLKAFNSIVKEKNDLIDQHAIDLKVIEDKYKKQLDDLRTYYEGELNMEKNGNFTHRNNINKQYADKCAICQSQLLKTYESLAHWKEDLTARDFSLIKMFSDLLEKSIKICNETKNAASSHGRMLTYTDDLKDMARQIDNFSKTLSECTMVVPPNINKISMD